MLKHLLNRVRHELQMVKQQLSDEQLRERIEAVVAQYSREAYLTPTQMQSYTQQIYENYRGLDILQPLMEDNSITEIMINHYNEIFIERDGYVHPYEHRFESPEKLVQFVHKMVKQVYPDLNEAPPIVDIRLENGSHVNIVMPPVALNGPTMTIRKVTHQPVTLEMLVEKGTLTSEAAHMLKILVQSKYNIFICGGTRSGKTTLLNALANCIPNDERIITIEDVAELQIGHISNLVQMEAWQMDSKGKNRDSIRELIHRSLRMRPNRIVVGEIRGAEAAELLQAMNVGFDGSLSTGNATSSEDMLSRLESMVLSGTYLPIEVVRKQISSAIDIIIHLSQHLDTRIIMEISEVLGVRNGQIQLNPLYQWVEQETDNAPADGILQRTPEPFIHTAKLCLAGYREDELESEFQHSAPARYEM